MASANAIYGNDKKGQDRLLRLRVLAFRSLQDVYKRQLDDPVLDVDHAVSVLGDVVLVGDQDLSLIHI